MLISIVIFSAVILGLAGLAFQIARRSTRATHDALVMARMQALIDKATTVPYDSLSQIATCDTTASGAVRVIGCLSLTTLTPRTLDVRVIVTTTVPGGLPDTVTIRRGRGRNPIPLR